MKIGILGGGLTGLTIASQINKKYSVDVIEKEKECGGLCRSLKEQGFTFDWGGAHILYSKDPLILNFALNLLGKNLVNFHRDNKISFKDRFVKYPFENGLSQLPLKDNVECLFHYLFKPSHKTKENFKEWLYAQFGRGIVEKYLLAYNEKIWDIKAENLNLEWVAGRIPESPLIDILKSSLGVSTEGNKIQLNAFYPERGGIQSLVLGLEKLVKNVKRGLAVTSIKKLRNQWEILFGENRSDYDKIVSTIPIPELLVALKNVPGEVSRAASNLRYNSLVSVMLGVKGKVLPRVTAIYFSESGFLPNRVAFPSNFSEKNAPEGKSSLIAEISTFRYNKVNNLSDKQIINEVVSGLVNKKIISRDQIIYSNVKKTKYAYVVYDKKYDRNSRLVRSYLDSLGIVLAGRFGEFKYLNMDASISRALEVSRQLMS